VNAEHYKDWIKTKVLPQLTRKVSYIAGQSAVSYQKVLFSWQPKLYWKKDKIIEWFNHHDIIRPLIVNDFKELGKASLIEYAKEFQVPEINEIQELVNSTGRDIKLLYLPVAHGELNPIEFIWAFVKNKIATLSKEGGEKYVFRKQYGLKINFGRDLVVEETVELLYGRIGINGEF